MSEHCPECQGLGLVVKFFHMVPCELCKANDLGNSHLGLDDLFRPAYIHMLVMGEKSPWYWAWLKHMIDTKQIDPNARVPSQRHVSVFLNSIMKTNE